MDPTKSAVGDDHHLARFQIASQLGVGDSYGTI